MVSFVFGTMLWTAMFCINHIYPCIIEKKDLVELVLQTNDDKAESRRPAPNLPPSRSWEDTTIRVSDQVTSVVEPVVNILRGTSSLL